MDFGDKWAYVFSNGTARWYQKQIMITISAEPATHHPFAETSAWNKIWNIRVRCWNRSDHTLLGQKLEVLFSIFMVGSDPRRHHDPHQGWQLQRPPRIRIIQDDFHKSMVATYSHHWKHNNYGNIPKTRHSFGERKLNNAKFTDEGG